MDPETVKAWSPVLIALIGALVSVATAYFTYKATVRVKGVEARVETVEAVQAAQADVVLTLARGEGDR